ncbi:DNA primase [Methanothermococcus sp. SCGC AD-155-C09]|nr:DNA primase [Methanothermococcus sp. SCGC AD-155-C09]
MTDLGTTKYIIYAEVIANGYVEKHDIIGAIFGQTEGLLSGDLDIRDLQKSGRIGRIDVELNNINGKSHAKIILPSSLDKVETAILAATLETIDRVGPCLATVRILNIEDIRIKKRQYIADRAKELLKNLMDSMMDVCEISKEINEYIRVNEIIEYGEDRLPAGPNIDNSDAIIVVEGRADVVNLLRCGIKNAIAVEGTSIPKTIVELSKKKTTTIFTDGDRGGKLILKEALQTCDIDYIARAPKGREVEDLSKKEIVKYLRSKIPIEQYLQFNIKNQLNQNQDIQSSIDTECSQHREIPEVFFSDEQNVPNKEPSCSEGEIKSIFDICDENKVNESNTDDLSKDNKLSYEVLNTDDYMLKLEYLKSSIKEIKDSGKIKIIETDFENILSIDELSNDMIKSNIRFFISDVPITQKMVDKFFNYNKLNMIVIGREINITKKPWNLKILKYEDIIS